MSEDQIKIPVYTTEEITTYLGKITTDITRWIASVTHHDFDCNVDGQTRQLPSVTEIVLTVAPGCPALIGGVQEAPTSDVIEECGACEVTDATAAETTHEYVEGPMVGGGQDEEPEVPGTIGGIKSE
jgi:hypothetical protein